MPDPYSEWTIDALRHGLRDAERLYHLLGALYQRKFDFDVHARQLREVSDHDRQLMRIQTAAKLADLRFAMRRRGAHT